MVDECDHGFPLLEGERRLLGTQGANVERAEVRVMFQFELFGFLVILDSRLGFRLSERCNGFG